MKKESVRKVAIDILLAQLKEKKPVDVFYNRLTRNYSPRDRAFIKTIVFGVLRQKEYLDKVIEKFSKHPLKKMKPLTLVALEAGAYQLLFMDRVPPSAAVNETVGALKQYRQPQWLKGFVNGLLRTISKQRETIPSPEKAGAGGQPVINHPLWMFKRWQHKFGENAARKICQVNNQEPALTLRVNTRKTTREVYGSQLKEKGVQSTFCRYSPIGLQLVDYNGAIEELPGYDEGYFQIQDQAAQLATFLLGPFDKRAKVLDACAGLGGKTSHIIQEAGDSVSIVAVEPDKRRFSLLRDNISRLQYTNENITYVNSTLQNYAQGKSKCFDAIILDAPCSGTGVIRRNPDIRWNREQDDFSTYQRLQIELLGICASLLAPGGRLVYATCSLESEENEDVVHHFLSNNKEFGLVNGNNILPGSVEEVIDENGYFRPLPATDIDGFFSVAFDRQSNL